MDCYICTLASDDGEFVLTLQHAAALAAPEVCSLVVTTSLELTNFQFILHSGLCAISIHKSARKLFNVAKTIASSIALAALMIYNR